jgi:hypothetical protein
MSDMKRDWAQSDIIEETRRVHQPGQPGFFNTLWDVCTAAFGGRLKVDDLGYPDAVQREDGGSWEDLPPPGWRLPMGELTVSQVLDFFDAHQAGDPIIKWHNEVGRSTAEIVIADYHLAEAFRKRFKIDWDSCQEAREWWEEDHKRAASRLPVRNEVAAGTNARIAKKWPVLSASTVNTPVVIASATHGRPAASRSRRQTGWQNTKIR